MSFYPSGRMAFFGKDIDWEADTFKVALMSDDYTYDDTDEDLADINGDHILSTQEITSKSLADGLAKSADPITFLAVEAATIGGIIVYHDTGVAATSKLIRFVAVERELAVVSDVTLTWVDDVVL